MYESEVVGMYDVAPPPMGGNTAWNEWGGQIPEEALPLPGGKPIKLERGLQYPGGPSIDNNFFARRRAVTITPFITIVAPAGMQFNVYLPDFPDGVIASTIKLRRYKGEVQPDPEREGWFKIFGGLGEATIPPASGHPREYIRAVREFQKVPTVKIE